MAVRPGNEGYVTLAVLLVAALLAAVVSSLVAASRPALGLVRIGADQAAADGLLQGGVEAAAYLLYDAKLPLSDVDGLTLGRGAGDILVHAADEAGRVDVNAAKPELLAGLYAAVGASAMPPAAFAARVVDWRDQDDEAGKEDGAEADEYERAGSPYRPPNRRFRSVDELRFLLGLGADDFRRLAPYVTVHTGVATVDPLSAPGVVLLAIPGFGVDQVKLIAKAREQGLDREEIGALVQQGREFLSTTPSGVYRLSVSVRLRDGFTDALETVVVAPGQGDDESYGVVASARRTAARAD